MDNALFLNPITAHSRSKPWKEMYEVMSNITCCHQIFSYKGHGLGKI